VPRKQRRTEGVALVVFAVYLSKFGPSMDDTQPEPATRVRRHLEALIARSATPGLQYVVVDAGHTVFEFAGGWTDIARLVPMDPRSTMMAYSMSKTITAAAVLQLIGAGSLGLDDPIQRHLPEVPYVAKITVRQLLSHTSGIPNPIPLFDDATRSLFYEQQRTAGGKPIVMTLGWHIGELRGLRFYFKEGGGGGFHSEMRLYPGTEIATVLITNSTGFDVKRALNAVDPAFARPTQN
jgi:CubicO group peptidase (beta-lactamase class C family)